LSALGGSSAGGATAGDAVPAAGSIRNVNPTGGDMNCVNCAIATDATLRGNPASALPGSPTSLVVLQQQFGSRFAPATTSSIEQSLLQQGNGATGIVYGFPPAGSDVGHVFNVVNQNGTIRYLDGQTGTVANPAVFPKLLFMPVKPIGAK
jgi:filamentous hemagglutinin